MNSGLAVAYPYTPDTYSPVQPLHAALQMMQIMHTHMSALTAYAGAMPDLLVNLRDRYQVTRSPDDLVQHLVGRKLINERIAAEHSAARKEVLAAQPGPRKPENLALSFERDTAGLRRGLAMRTVYNASVRRVTAIGSWGRTWPPSVGKSAPCSAGSRAASSSTAAWHSSPCTPTRVRGPPTKPS
nr:hypothetical protein OG781_41710 [Streptomyces sp. NBC_00830]